MAAQTQPCQIAALKRTDMKYYEVIKQFIICRKMFLLEKFQEEQKTSPKPNSRKKKPFSSY